MPSTSRWSRARADTPALQDVKPTIARATVAAALTLTVGATWPAAVGSAIAGVAIFVAAFGLTVAAHYAWNLSRADHRIALDRLADSQRENERLAPIAATAEHHGQLADVLQQRVRELERACAISAATANVWAQVYNEQTAGTVVPLAAVIARLDLATQVATGEIKNGSASEKAATPPPLQ
jgi:hypothetical protein